MRFFKKPWVIGLLLIIVLTVIIFIIPIEKRQYGLSENAMTTDYTGLMPQKIQSIQQGKTREQLISIVKEANEKGQKLSIAGVQHSQGGHTYFKDAIVVDMKPFNKILAIDEQEKTVTVEAGALVSDVQEAVAKKGLAMKVSQSIPIFTVGGSLSVNGHGRDIRYGSMASTVQKMTIITPTGQLEQLNRKTDNEKMTTILGGYGLFGIIVDVTFELVDDVMYKYEAANLVVADYEKYLHKVLNNPEIAMHYARVSVDPKNFLDDMYAMNYYETGKKSDATTLKKEQYIHLSKWALDLARQGGGSETTFWNLQKKLFATQSGKEISRNDAMRGESTFMEYVSPNSVEVLQEFFIPVDEYEEFIVDMKKWLPKNDADEAIKLHNITLRILSKDESKKLNYAREPMIAFVLLIQHPTSEQGLQQATTYIQKWTDTALAHNGTYYLPYYPYQTTEQFMQAYPQASAVNKLKKEMDPNIVFMNNFYENYLSKATEK